MAWQLLSRCFVDFLSMEKQLADEYLNAFADEWHIYKEVWGVSIHSRNSKRIDAIIINKLRPEIKFGIEFKRIDLSSFHNFTAWFKQSLIYTQCNFGSMGRIPILVAPEMNYQNDEKLKFFCDRMLGEFGVGSIQSFYHTASSSQVYKIKMQGNTFYTLYAGQTGVFNSTYKNMDFNSRLEL